MRKLLIIPSLFSLLLGCTSQDQSPPITFDYNTLKEQKFTHNLWHAKSILNEEISEDVKVTLLVGNDNSISGRSGCNQYRSIMALNKNDIKFAKSSSTMMACSPQLMAIENSYLSTIESASKYDINSVGQLKFYNSKGENILIFSPVDGAYQSVSGTVSYRERIALAPNAILTVNLLDVSKMDVPAKVIATKEYALNGQQVPFHFELKYLAETINDRHTYSIQAQIKSDDALLFTSTGANPVLTREAKNIADILLEKVFPAHPKKSTLVNYTCERDTYLSVSFARQTIANGDQQIAIVNSGHNKPIILPQEPTASGFLYTNSKYSLRGKGEEVLWTVGRMKSLHCAVDHKGEATKSAM